MSAVAAAKVDAPAPYGAWAIFTHPFVPVATATHTAFVPPTFPASKEPALLAV
jgi:hypothetical protein